MNTVEVLKAQKRKLEIRLENKKRRAHEEAFED